MQNQGERSGRLIASGGRSTLLTGKPFADFFGLGVFGLGALVGSHFHFELSPFLSVARLERFELLFVLHIEVGKFLLFFFQNADQFIDLLLREPWYRFDDALLFILHQRYRTRE